MRSLALYSFLLILLVYCDDEETLSEKIKKYAEAISEVTQSGGDILEVLEKVAETSAKICKLGGPIGGIFAGSMVFDPESPELKALSDMAEKIQQGFDSKEIEINENEMQYAIHGDFFLFYDYEREVTLKMISLMADLKTFTDQRIYDKGAISGPFQRTCLFHRPLSILRFLKQRLVENCAMTTSKDVHMYVKLLKAFRLLEWKMNATSRSLSGLYEETKILTLIHLAHLNEEKANELARAINNIQGDEYGDYVTELKKVAYPRISLPNGKSCLLDMMTKVYGHRRAYANSFLLGLAEHLVQLQSMVIACSNLTLNGNKTLIDDELQETADGISSIGKHVVRWIRNSQAESWYSVSMEAARTLLGPNQISTHSYNETARVIHHEFAIRGNRSESHHIIVTSALKYNDYWFISSMDSNIHKSLLDYNGIHVHVFKHQLPVSTRGGKAAVWFEENRSAISDALKLWIDRRPSILPLFFLNKFGMQPYQEDLYRSVLFLKYESRSDAISNLLKVGISYNHNGGTDGYSSIEHVYFDRSSVQGKVMKIFFVL